MSNFKRVSVTGGGASGGTGGRTGRGGLQGRSPAPAAKRKDPLASLKMAQMLTGPVKSLLPIEILAMVVDCLPIPELLRFARVSKQMKEMVYDDARWVQRLKRMGCWDEVEARARLEGNYGVGAAATGAGSDVRGSLANTDTVNGKGRPTISTEITTGPVPPGSVGILPTKRRMSLKAPVTLRHELEDGFDAIPLSSPGGSSTISKPNEIMRPIPLNTAQTVYVQALTILKHVRSIRGQARQEYGVIYRCLGPFYNDLVQSESPLQSSVFKVYDSPEQQAQILNQLTRFTQSDFAPGAGLREIRLSETISIFDTAAILEFRRGYEDRDISGRMQKYGHVLYSLNGGKSSIDLFLNQNRLIMGKSSLGNPTDCIDYSTGRGQVSLERTQLFFDRLTTEFNQEAAIIQKVFPTANEVLFLFLEKVGREVLSPFLTSLFDEAHTRSVDCYLKTVSGTFVQVQQFVRDIPLEVSIAEAEQPRSTAVMASIFEPHLDLYLAEELGYFKQRANSEVDEWSRALSEQAASTETFLLSNINRQADKKDFMSSFKKVVMMPVNILPSFPTRSTNKTVAKVLVNGDSDLATSSATQSRSSTPLPRANPLEQVRSSTPSLPAEAPTSELAAKAAIMKTKLETIRSLFSIEVALNLVHSAKSSLERAAQFVTLGGDLGEAAKQQCVSIFVMLLQILGLQHVKAGFDRAVDHLSGYNPREENAQQSSDRNITKSDDYTTPTTRHTPQVAPLATFLELVNVGDLIQQMLDVFYESELIRLRLSNRDDFLDPAVKEKRKFEAMLDERVAAGLSKGIDVLMDEVEFLCATSQMPFDFNPPTNPAFLIDLDPTLTARKVIAVVDSHTSMLTGSTDKTLLDVFSAEVGLRLFSALCKHLKRQRISPLGAPRLLSDLAAYDSYVRTFKNSELNSYFAALRHVAQIYLVDMGRADATAKAMATIIADGERYAGVFTVEEVLEFVERRSDWLELKGNVEKETYGNNCVVM